MSSTALPRRPRTRKVTAKVGVTLQDADQQPVRPIVGRVALSEHGIELSSDPALNCTVQLPVAFVREMDLHKPIYFPNITLIPISRPVHVG